MRWIPRLKPLKATAHSSRALPETGTNTVLADAENTNGDATATATSNESAAVVNSNLNSEDNATAMPTSLCVSI